MSESDIRYLARAGRFHACLPIYSSLHDTAAEAQAAVLAFVGVFVAGEYADRLRARGVLELNPDAHRGCDYAMVEAVEVDAVGVADVLGLAITPGAVVHLTELAMWPVDLPTIKIPDDAVLMASVTVKRPFMRHPPCVVECRCDGNQVGAMIGPNIMQGVVGYGDTLADALRSLADAIEAEVEVHPVPIAARRCQECGKSPCQTIVKCSDRMVGRWQADTVWRLGND